MTRRRFRHRSSPQQAAVRGRGRLVPGSRVTRGRRQPRVQPVIPVKPKGGA